MVRNAVKSLTRYKMHLLHSLVALYIIIYAVTKCNLICSLFNNIILHSLSKFIFNHFWQQLYFSNIWRLNFLLIITHIYIYICHFVDIFIAYVTGKW